MGKSLFGRIITGVIIITTSNDIAKRLNFMYSYLFFDWSFLSNTEIMIDLFANSCLIINFLSFDYLHSSILN